MTKIIEFKCCGCELDEETDIDVNVLMQRNKYCAENYFIGNESIPNEEIQQWLNRMKNPALIKVLAERQKRKDCISERPPQFIPSPAPSVASVATSQRSIDLVAQIYERPHGDYIRKKPKSEMEKFDYPANDFDEKEFLEHVAQPGPEERYYYFQNHKKLYSIRENVKNVSMI
ncbi:hypothetical protein DOY81_010056 [Sarcophaga bullata]|nr:hypothetical protein DOY81_010056 [Sarcophaga bullata]